MEEPVHTIKCTEEVLITSSSQTQKIHRCSLERAASEADTSLQRRPMSSIVLCQHAYLGNWYPVCYSRMFLCCSNKHTPVGSWKHMQGVPTRVVWVCPELFVHVWWYELVCIYMCIHIDFTRILLVPNIRRNHSTQLPKRDCEPSKEIIIENLNR